MKIFLRTIFYQFFLLFVGGTIGFIANAEYIGWKSVIVERSLQNIFAPIEYDEEVEQFVLDIGYLRLCTALNGHPYDGTGITILDEFVWNEEVYIARYEYQPADGKKIVQDYSTRVRWKSWEYYYEYHGPEGVSMDELFGPEDDGPAPPGPAPQAVQEKPPAPAPWPHVDKNGKPVPGPVHIPNHPSLKPWWQR